MSRCHICRHTERDAPHLPLDGPFAGPTCGRCRVLVIKQYELNRASEEQAGLEELHSLDSRMLLGLRLRRLVEQESQLRMPERFLPSALRV